MSDYLTNSQLYSILYVTEYRDPEHLLHYNSKFLSTFFINNNDIADFTNEFFNSYLSAEQWAFGNPTQNITNIVAFPLYTELQGDYDSGDAGKVMIGGVSRSAMVGYQKPELFRALYRVAYLKVEPTYDDFRKYSGYTRYRLFLPYYGYVELKADDIVDKWIQVLLKPDYTTGRALYIIGVTDQALANEGVGHEPLSDTSKGYISNLMRIIDTIEFQLGVELPVGSSNVAEVTRNRLLATAQAAFSVAMLAAPIPSTVATATTTETTVRNIKTKNPETNRMNTKTRIQDTTTSNRTTTYDNSGYVKQQRLSSCFESGLDVLRSFNYETQKNNPSSPSLAGALYLKVHLIEYTPNYVEQDENFNRLYGRPLGQTKKLSTLDGYTEISAIHIEGDAFKTATSEELAMLEEELTGGIFL